MIKCSKQKHLVDERVYSPYTSRLQCATEERQGRNSNRKRKAGLLAFLVSINHNMGLSVR